MIARLLALCLIALPASAAPGAAPPDARARLAAALGRYQAIAERGGWASMPAGPLVRPGETDEVQVGALRRRLAAEGTLGAAARTGATLDPALADALR